MISDAGTPTISDPGLVLINECIKNNKKIFPIPEFQLQQQQYQYLV